MLRQTSQNCKSSYTSRLKPEEIHLKYPIFKDLESHSLCPSNVLKKVVKVAAVLVFRCLSHKLLYKHCPLNLSTPPIMAYQFPSTRYCFKIITEHPNKVVRGSWAGTREVGVCQPVFRLNAPSLWVKFSILWKWFVKSKSWQKIW